MRIAHARACKPRFERDGVVNNRLSAPPNWPWTSATKLFWNALNRCNAAALVEDYKEQFAVARVYLTREGTDAGVGVAERAGLADDAAGEKSESNRPASVPLSTPATGMMSANVILYLPRSFRRARSSFIIAFGVTRL